MQVSSAEPAARQRMRLLDECLNLVESAIEAGRTRVNGELAAQLGHLLERARTPPPSRLAGRLIERVLDDLFLIQKRVMSEPADRAY
jgi:hypothetical protein